MLMQFLLPLLRGQGFRRTARWTLFALVAAALPLTAQITAGLRGTITDPTGAAVPGAQITVVHEKTGLALHSTSAESGAYTFNLLPIGTYRISVDAAGFQHYDQTGIVLTTNQVAGINIELVLGALSEKVNVVSTGTIVNTQTTEVGTLIGGARMTELPLNGRNPIQLALLAAGRR